MKTRHLAVRRFKPMAFALAVIVVSIVAVSAAEHPLQSTGHLTPSPKRPTQADIVRLIASKRPPARVCNAVAASCNPIPDITSLSPASVAPGATAFNLIVNGAAFVPSSVVQWDFAPLATTYLSSNQLSAVVTSDLVANSGIANITVASPAPGGGTSPSVSFSIGDNPSPTVSFVFPPSV